ncbi:alpha/beta hydrolase fold domain-containing protein [Spirosoma areae]
MKSFSFLVVASTLWIQTIVAFGQKVTRQENVVYGVVAGTGLLMDVYQPATSNHLGIVFIAGNGWGFFDQRIYNQSALKEAVRDTAYNGKWVESLIRKGYTVFMINHRFAPQFHAPDILSDCQRAVRYIRYNARRFGIDAQHIGAMGHSSGAVLSSMLGVTDAPPELATDPIDSLSSRVQAVVTMGAPFMLWDINRKADTTLTRNLALRMFLNYIGELPDERQNEFISSGKYAQASPITHVTKGDAATLIYYSDDDFFTPLRQSPRMYQALQEQGVPAKLVLTHKQRHWPKPDMEEVDRWFRTYLK